MKTFLIGLLSGVVACCLLYLWWVNHENSKKPDPVIEYVENTHKIDSLTFVIDNLNTKAKESNMLINAQKAKIEIQKKETLTAKYIADSLERAYLSDKTIELCDSVLKAKNEVISNQDSTIKSYNLEIKQIELKVSVLENTIAAKDEIIVQKDLAIDNLKCAANWKIRHKFWAWVFRWKCNS